MHVGILNAIHPQQSKVNWGGSPIDAYVRFLHSGGAAYTFQRFEVAQGEFPEAPGICDVYLITGSPRGVYDSDPWIGTLRRFVQESFAEGRKLVGICFGHQMLAHALGGQAQKSEKGWGLGQKRIAITRPKAWMDPPRTELALYFAHQDQVVRLPSGAELLGGNEFVPNALFAIEDRVLGIQGHPEFDKQLIHQIVENNRLEVPEQTYRTALTSLEDTVPDNKLAARWIVEFLNGKGKEFTSAIGPS